MADFKEELDNKLNEVTKVLDDFAPLEEGHQKRVLEAVNYSFMAGGKRLRPMFVIESFRLFNGTDFSVVTPFMAAIEMVHTYSLIHDDLPAMDNDDYRRGRLTNHKRFDEATAILAGDGLLNFAFETIAKAMDEENDPTMLKRMAKANCILSNKAGVYGMIGGQMVDIIKENCPDTTEEELYYIHENKTGALIESALMMGAVLAGADDNQLKMMEKVGSCVGHAFQIQDDILDVTGDEKSLGKPVGSDEKNDKVTFVSMKGLDQAKKVQEEYVKEAVNTLHELPFENEFLEELLLSLITRTK